MDPALAESERARTTADHSKFKELQQDFLSGPEVTRACLSCHTEAAKQVMHTLHWKWETINPKNQQRLGKRHVVNNFCTSVGSNLHACATCHVGYAAMTDKGLIEEPERVDCLVCHATVSYSKPTGLGGNVVAKDVELPPGSGNVIRGQNLRKIAQSVGKTSRRSCGTCHFMGGGGDGVKHGDLDSSLEDPDRKLDVHMDVEGLNFTCATCHQTDGHRVPGSRYTPTAADKDGPMIRGKGSERNPATCQSCHGQTPHKGRNAGKLNDHTVKLACQTCHVPAYARGGIATKLSWDWSTAGRRDAKGKQFVVKDKDGNKIYESRKGSFTFGENVKPQYMWLNGEVIYTLPGDKVDKSAEPIYINRYLGSPDDGRSRIWPVKVFHGNQPYDPVNKTLVVTHLAGADDTAYWTNLDWHKAIETGMRTAGLPFSGQVDFIRTLSVWPITHMVAPKEDALACAECHSRDGRLAKVEGVYIPGRDHIPLLDQTAKWLAILALAGVLVHAGIRVYAHIARKRSH
ncbi:MAG: tetrathionate reductase family octaheme c-type cytochrome [Thiobacillaceae bacterium]|nr:tetrathionate reductase family octaheme c-type cytochrome [Thiobacillaceae bacterium]